jgi:hypothetical protein
MIAKYTKTNCIKNILGRGQKRKRKTRISKTAQRKIKIDRQKLAPSLYDKKTNENLT